MKKAKKKLLILFSSCAFIALMLFNVSVSMDGSDTIPDVSLTGVQLAAQMPGEGPGDGGGLPQCTGMMCVGNFSCYGIICSDICVFTGDTYGRCEMSYGFFVGCTQQACFTPFSP